LCTTAGALLATGPRTVMERRRPTPRKTVPHRRRHARRTRRVDDLCPDAARSRPLRPSRMARGHRPRVELARTSRRRGDRAPRHGRSGQLRRPPPEPPLSAQRASARRAPS
jgi:hypothetical protein